MIYSIIYPSNLLSIFAVHQQYITQMFIFSLWSFHLYVCILNYIFYIFTEMSKRYSKLFSRESLICSSMFHFPFTRYWPTSLNIFFFKQRCTLPTLSEESGKHKENKMFSSLWILCPLCKIWKIQGVHLKCVIKKAKHWNLLRKYNSSS